MWLALMDAKQLPANQAIISAFGMDVATRVGAKINSLPVVKMSNNASIAHSIGLS